MVSENDWLRLIIIMAAQDVLITIISADFCQSHASPSPHDPKKIVMPISQAEQLGISNKERNEKSLCDKKRRAPAVLIPGAVDEVK